MPGYSWRKNILTNLLWVVITSFAQKKGVILGGEGGRDGHRAFPAAFKKALKKKRRHLESLNRRRAFPFREPGTPKAEGGDRWGGNGISYYGPKELADKKNLKKEATLDKGR